MIVPFTVEEKLFEQILSEITAYLFQ